MGRIWGQCVADSSSCKDVKGIVLLFGHLVVHRYLGIVLCSQLTHTDKHRWRAWGRPPSNDRACPMTPSQIFLYTSTIVGRMVWLISLFFAVEKILIYMQMYMHTKFFFVICWDEYYKEPGKPQNVAKKANGPSNVVTNDPKWLKSDCSEATVTINIKNDPKNGYKWPNVTKNVQKWPKKTSPKWLISIWGQLKPTWGHSPCSLCPTGQKRTLVVYDKGGGYFFHLHLDCFLCRDWRAFSD